MRKLGWGLEQLAPMRAGCEDQPEPQAGWEECVRMRLSREKGAVTGADHRRSFVSEEHNQHTGSKGKNDINSLKRIKGILITYY